MNYLCATENKLLIATTMVAGISNIKSALNVEEIIFPTAIPIIDTRANSTVERDVVLDIPAKLTITSETAHVKNRVPLLSVTLMKKPITNPSIARSANMNGLRPNPKLITIPPMNANITPIRNAQAPTKFSRARIAIQNSSCDNINTYAHTFLDNRKIYKLV